MIDSVVMDDEVQKITDYLLEVMRNNYKKQGFSCISEIDIERKTWKGYHEWMCKNSGSDPKKTQLVVVIHLTSLDCKLHLSLEMVKELSEHINKAYIQDMAAIKLRKGFITTICDDIKGDFDVYEGQCHFRTSSLTLREGNPSDPISTIVI